MSVPGDLTVDDVRGVLGDRAAQFTDAQIEEMCRAANFMTTIALDHALQRARYPRVPVEDEAAPQGGRS